MWMMGYNEPHEDHHLSMNMVESYTNNGNCKLKPLVPRPSPPSSSNRFQPTHFDHLLHLNHHLGEQNKREFNSEQMVVVSSRWNPTPEQLQTLEELYRRGTRTPSAEEIQHITAQLRRYGKIEGKNVFYWFQNHKARERQKRRRQLDKPNNQPPFFSTDNINVIHFDQPLPHKESGVEETKNWAIRTFSEKSVLKENAECRMANNVPGDHEGWMHNEQGQQQQQQQQQYQEFEEQKGEEEGGGGGNDEMLLIHRTRKNIPARNATWNHMMMTHSNLSFPSSSTNQITTLITSTKTTSSTVVSPHHHVDSYQTLELFPVNNNNTREQPEKCFVPASDVSLSPRQFIEFLPLKN